MLDVGDGVIGAHRLVIVFGTHAPHQVEHVKDALVAGEGEDVRLGPHAADLEGRVSAVGHGDNGLDVDGGGHLHAGHANGIGHHALVLAQPAFLHVEHDLALHPFEQPLVHHLHHFHVMLAHTALGAEHHGIVVVGHGIGHLVHLGTGGRAALDHALHHLSGHD